MTNIKKYDDGIDRDRLYECYDDGIDRDWLYECCFGLLTDENSDLNGVNFTFSKNVKNEVIVHVWKDVDQ